jgi:hypothetical protein
MTEKQIARLRGHIEKLRYDVDRAYDWARKAEASYEEKVLKLDDAERRLFAAEKQTKATS